MNTTAIKAAAEKRAAISAILSSAKDQVPVPIYQIMEHPDLKKFKLTQDSLRDFLSSMQKGRLIRCVRLEDDPKASHGYVMFENKKYPSARIKQHKEKGIGPAKAPTVKPAVEKVIKGAAKGKPVMRIDYLKNTGRVRLEFEDIVITVGVVNE